MSTILGARWSLRTTLLTTVLASAGLLAGTSAGRARATATPPDVLAALLIEVRGLRAAMEQMASAGPRVQLALGRLQLQEQRVNAVVRRLEDAKTNLVQSQKGLEALRHRMADSSGSLAKRPSRRSDAKQKW